MTTEKARETCKRCGGKGVVPDNNSISPWHYMTMRDYPETRPCPSCSERHSGEVDRAAPRDAVLEEADVERAFEAGRVAANLAACQHAQFRTFLAAAIRALASRPAAGLEEASERAKIVAWPSQPGAHVMSDNLPAHPRRTMMPKPDIAELRGCPFCGGPGYLTRFDDPPEDCGWHVVCHGKKLCPLFCSEPYSDLLTRKEAIAAWNTRTPAPSEEAGSEGVIQADRDAAADFHAPTGPVGDEIRCGSCDHWRLVQAFARHRLRFQKETNSGH